MRDGNMLASDIRIVTLGTTSTCIKDTSPSTTLMSDKCTFRIYERNNTIKNHRTQHQHQIGKHTIKVQFTNTSNIQNCKSINSTNNNDTACLKGKNCHSNTVNRKNYHQHQQVPCKHISQQHQHINQVKQSSLIHPDSKNKKNCNNRNNSTNNISTNDHCSTALHLVKCGRVNSPGVNKRNYPAHNYAEMTSNSQFTPPGHIIQNHPQQYSPSQMIFCKHQPNQSIITNTKSSPIIATCSTSSVLVTASSCHRSSCQQHHKNLAKVRFPSPSKKRRNTASSDQTPHFQHQQKHSKHHLRTSVGTNSGSKLKDFVVIALAASKCNLNANHSNNTSSKRKSLWKNSVNRVINSGEAGREGDSGENGRRSSGNTAATIISDSSKHSQSGGDQDKKTNRKKSHELEKLPILEMTTALTNAKLSPVPSTATTTVIAKSNSTISLANSVSSTAIVASSASTTTAFTSIEQSESYDDSPIRDTKDEIVNADKNNSSVANGSKTSEPKAQTSTVNKTIPSTSHGCSSSGTSGPSSPNSYTLDFLHSVGVQMTGGANLARHKIGGLRLPPMTASPSHLCGNSSRGLSPGRNVYAYTNILGNQRQQRYVYSGGFNGGSSNHDNGNHHYPRYHHPPKLTIASFLQKDLLPEPALASPNCNNYFDHSGRPHSAHYAPQQSHRYHHNYYHHQSHYQQQQSASPHQLIYTGCRQHKSISNGSSIGYGKGVNTIDGTRIVSDGDQAYYMAAVLDNDNHHYQSQGQNQGRHNSENSTTTTKSNTSRSVSSTSSSSSSTSTNISGAQQRKTMKLNKTIEGDSKSQKNYKSKPLLGHNRYIQRSYQYYQHHPTSGNYYPHHRISNQPQHRHYYQQSQRSSITTAGNAPQHQNYYNLTYVTPNKNVVPNMGNNSISASAITHNHKLSDNPSSSSAIYIYNSMNTASNYEHHRQNPHQYNIFSQQQQNHENQQNYDYTKKILVPNFTLPAGQSSSHPVQYSTQAKCKISTDASTSEGKDITHTINEVLNESELKSTAQSINENTNIKDNDSDTSSSHSSAISSQCHQVQKYQAAQSLSNSSSSASSVASGMHHCNSMNTAGSPLTMPQVPVDHNYRFHQNVPQLAASTEANNVAYTQNVPTTTITGPSQSSQSCHNGMMPTANQQVPSSEVLAHTEDESKSKVRSYSSTINSSSDDQQLILNASSTAVTGANCTALSSRSTSSSSGYWSPSQLTKYRSIGDATSSLSLSDFDNLQCQPQDKIQSDLSKTSFNLSSSLDGGTEGLADAKRYTGSCPNSLNQRLAPQQQQSSTNSLPNASCTGLNSSVRSRNSGGRNQQLSGGTASTSFYQTAQFTAPSQSHAFVHQQQNLQQSPVPHNMMYCNPTVHMRSANGSSVNNASMHDAITMHTPPDRFLARAHLIEMKEPPIPLVNNSKWDHLSQNIWKKFVSFQQTQETFKQKMHLWRYLYLFIKNTYPRFGLYLVGSTISGFGADSSDVDMCLVSRNSSSIEPRIESLYNLTVLRDCLSKSGEFEHFNLIEAKVPILRFRDRIHQIEVDLNFNNCVGIKNTHLLYCYSQLDWRLRPLVLVVKLWAQYHNINNAKNMTISSYSLVLMVIHFLQCAVNPPVLPCLHATYPDKFPLLRSNEFGYVDMNELIDPYESKNSQTLGELFLSFLEYYSCFDYAQFAISVRTGGLLPINVCRTAKSLKNDIHQWKELCIEEPFDLTNTARSVYDFETFERVKAVFAASWHVLQESLDLNTIFSPIILSMTGSIEESESCTSTKGIVKELTLAAAATENSLSNEQCNDNKIVADDKQGSKNCGSNKAGKTNVSTDAILDNNN